MEFARNEEVETKKAKRKNLRKIINFFSMDHKIHPNRKLGNEMGKFPPLQ